MDEPPQRKIKHLKGERVGFKQRRTVVLGPATTWNEAFRRFFDSRGISQPSTPFGRMELSNKRPRGPKP